MTTEENSTGSEAALATAQAPRSKEVPMSMENKNATWALAQSAVSWYTWDSPVGLSLFLVGLGVAGVLFRYVVTGH